MVALEEKSWDLQNYYKSSFRRYENLYHGNPSNNCEGILLKIKNVTLLLKLAEMLGDQSSVGFIL